MALVGTQIGALTAPDGTVCTVTITEDDTTGAIDHVSVVNNTGLAANFWAQWRNNTFTTSVPAHTTQTWTPSNQMKNQAKWLTDPIPFGWGLG